MAGRVSFPIPKRNSDVLNTIPDRPLTPLRIPVAVSELLTSKLTYAMPQPNFGLGKGARLDLIYSTEPTERDIQ